jgi:hypothetical protein
MRRWICGSILITGGTMVTKDDRGCECIDRERLQRLTLQALADIAADELMRADPPMFTILVRDEAGNSVPNLSSRYRDLVGD